MPALKTSIFATSIWSFLFHYNNFLEFYTITSNTRWLFFFLSTILFPNPRCRVLSAGGSLHLPENQVWCCFLDILFLRSSYRNGNSKRQRWCLIIELLIFYNEFLKVWFNFSFFHQWLLAPKFRILFLLLIISFVYFS